MAPGRPKWVETMVGEAVLLTPILLSLFHEPSLPPSPNHGLIPLAQCLRKTQKAVCFTGYSYFDPSCDKPIIDLPVNMVL